MTSKTPEIDLAAPHALTGTGTTTIGRAASALAGLACGGAAVALGVVLSGLLDTVSPLNAVGSAFIDRTPSWLKDWAIDTFGTADKTALRVGIYAVLAAASVVAGLLHRRVRWAGPAFFGVFAALGAWASVTRAGQTGGASVAPLIAAVVGAVLLDRVVHQRRQQEVPGPSAVPLGWDRRRFVGAAAATAGGAAVLAAVGRTQERNRIADVEADRPDSLPPASTVAPPADSATAAPLVNVTPFVTPNDNFYRIDTALSFPTTSLDRWRLRIDGLVDRPLELSYDDLLAKAMIERTITICCVSNEVGGPYIGNAVWQGVLLSDLLDEAGVQESAEQVFNTSLDGWTCGFPVSAALDGRDCLVAIGMNGEALPLQHGFPARLIVPGLYGYVSATKWLSRIELTTWSAREGYWVPRGWAREAPIKTHSRIDVPRRGEPLAPGPTAIAGVAWAQHRGIQRVEVRVDDGPWTDAMLADDVSDDAWRQWWMPWDATEGQHRLQVRATDKTGETQTEEVAPVAPDGATGYHTRQVTVG